MKTLATDNTNEANYLLGNSNKNNGKRWSTVQCLLFAFVIAALVGFFSNLDRIIDELADNDEDNQISEEKITEIVSNRDELSTLNSALTSADLEDTLSGDGPFTLFAPTNNAFDAIVVPENISTLTDVLTYHVLGQSVLSTELTNGLVVETLNGETITTFLSDEGVFFYDSNGRISQVTEADIVGENGVIHIVDSVFLPDGTINDIVQNVPSLSSLNGALAANGLSDTLADPTATFTLFAPTNDAISMFTGNIAQIDLLYHVVGSVFLSDDIPDTPTEITTVSGDILSVMKLDGEVFITDSVGRIAAVSIANIKGINGVVHVIDIVLAREEYRNIVDLAVGRDDLSTLVSALTTANLVDTLNGDGPFTVLAPTNDAFSAIDVPTNVTILTSVLVYHVIGATVLSSDLSSGLIANTLNGETVTAFLSDEGVFFYDSNGRISQVLEADIVGTNGVIHVIDTVLLPGGTINDIVQNVPSLSGLNGALIENGLSDTLADPTATFTLFAPTNDALAAFGADATAAVLTYHVLDAEYQSPNIPDGTTTLTTLNGATLNVIKNDTGVFVEDQMNRVATVTTANIIGVNGVVHIIDIVLSPTA